MLPVCVERHDDVDPKPFRDEITGLQGGPLAAVDGMAHYAHPEASGDLRGRVARAIVDHQHVGRHPGHRGRDLADDDGQVLGLVKGGDAHQRATQPDVRPGGL